MPVLSDNELILGHLVMALHEAEQYFNDVYNWAIYAEEKRPDTQEPDVLKVFAEYGIASSIFHFLKEKKPKEKEKIMSARPDLEWDQLVGRLGSLEGAIDALDESDTTLWERAIDKQLMEHAANWKVILESIPQLAIDEDDEGLVDNLMYKRDQLEYIAVGLLLIRARHPYLRGVQKIQKFQKAVHESDKIFRKLLGKKREIQYWADPVFWWRHKAE